jgi:hypothetical protein
MKRQRNTEDNDLKHDTNIHNLDQHKLTIYHTQEM